MCPIHCETPTMNSHPLLEPTSSFLDSTEEVVSGEEQSADKEQTDEEDEEDEDVLNRPIKTFIPDYERISYAYSALNNLYRGEDDDDNFQSFIGSRLVHFRAKEVIKKMSRRQRYIKNEKHVMLKSIKK